MRTSTTILAGFVAGITMTGGLSAAQETLIPKDMVYVSHGPSVMGIDKDEPGDSRNRPTPYERRMKTPWSAEAFHDEGPAHMVFLDSYLIDRFEVSNKDYGDFMRQANHPAPAYWDDPRLNKPEQPVVGVNWYDAKAYCE
jgi:formylglycine-generating enzyme required for sulfatase activity